MNSIYDGHSYSHKVIRAYVPTNKVIKNYVSSKEGRIDDLYELYKNQHVLNTKKLSLFLHEVCQHTKATAYLNVYYTIVTYELDL